MLKEQNGKVRSIDIAESMSFTKPSVSIAMKKLKEQHHIVVDENGYVELTESGYKIADRIYERHVESPRHDFLIKLIFISYKSNWIDFKLYENFYYLYIIYK